MFLDLESYPALVALKNNIAVISDEFSTAVGQNREVYSLLNPIDDLLEHHTKAWTKDNGFHQNQIGYDIRSGSYSTLSIFKEGMKIEDFNAVDLFPKTLGLLSAIDGVCYSSFFKLYAHAQLTPHAHSRKHAIFHLLLDDLEDGECVVTVGGEKRSMKYKGDCVLFDYSQEHGSLNTSNTDRINFIVDLDILDDPIPSHDKSSI
jgi:hypothetical protein